MDLINNVGNWPQNEDDLLKIPEVEYPFSVKEYGERLRALREEYGYSQKQVAAAIGCSHQHVAQIESGKKYKQINKKWVPVFARKYECSCSYLLGFTDERTGVWFDPQATLRYPIISYRPDEIIAIDALIRAYNRDRELFLLYLELSKDTPERRVRYREVLKKRQREDT
ncbi:helix-turn-helix domain-containing protein [Pseudoflavonifractor sp. HCP28S3_F10]|uniref:helix-turn-helix domain-containing protein n=1 Tax=Pseudoflavonifractor sp. HCP28S3_F10 TaxID=3438947 RepID=UPI003F8BFE05